MGEQKLLHLRPEQAFGPYDETKRATIPRAAVPADSTVGDIVRWSEGRLSRILGLEDESAVIDLNHPLAGKAVIVEVQVLDVGPALEEPSQ